MPRVALTVSPVVITGVLEALVSAETDGNSISNIGAGQGQAWIEVNNGAGSPINVTIKTPGKIRGLDIAEQVIAVANGTRQKIGPFDSASIYNQSDGTVHIDYSSVTTITVGAFRL